MEKSIVPVEASQCKIDSTGSLVPINSITIDLTGSMGEIERPAVHEHFSIRGFVAGMRQKDWKTCYPFAFEGEGSNLVEKLPPLDVPSFRWWQSRMPDLNSGWSMVPFVGASKVDVGTSSHHNVDGEKEGFLFWDKIGSRHGPRGSAREDKDNDPGTAIENPIHISERSAADVSDAALPTAEHVVYEVDEPEKAFPPRRKPKLRSLADIMVDEQNVENPKPRSALPNGAHETSADTEATFDAREKGIRIPQVKRKTAPPQDNRENIPQMKRKIPPPQDDRGLAGRNKRARRVENSDTESEENAPNRFDLLHAAKTQPIKPKKIKSLDIGKKARIENAIVPVKDVPKVNSEWPTNSHNQNVSSGIGFCKSRQQMERLPTFKVYDNGSKPHTISGDSNSKGKMVLDLSLSSSANAERCSGSQSSSRRNREIPDLNETFPDNTPTVRGKQLPTPSEKRSLPLYKNLEISASGSKETAAREGTRQLSISEQQTSQNTDGIPMDIIEMLAKNKIERERAISRNHLNGSSVRGSAAPYADKHPGIVRFPFANTRTVPDGSSGSFTHVNNKSLFNSLGLKTPSSASSSRATGRAADLYWPPRGQNGPFHQNVPFQANGIGVPSFSAECQQGRTISDIKDREEKRTEQEPLVRNPISVGSLDPYSNDHIPAMQLLSLMDRGIVSSSSFKVGPKSFLGKTFSPCNNHPPLHENQNFFNGSFVSQVGHSKDFLGLHYGGASSRQLHGQLPLEQRKSGSIHIVGPSNLVTQPLAGRNFEPGPCTLNRNPADFSIPDGRNEFTRSSKDMKPRKSSAAPERSRNVNLAGQKRQKVRKDAGGKEYSRK